MGNGKANRRTGPIVGITGVLVMAAAGASWVYGSRASNAELAIAPHGDIHQFGARVGWASGAKLSRADTAVVEFDEISNASNLRQLNEFEFSGLFLRIAQVKQVQYAEDPSLPTRRTGPPDVTLQQVTARIQGKR